MNHRSKIICICYIWSTLLIGCSKENKSWHADFLIEISISGKVFNCYDNQTLEGVDVLFLDIDLDYIRSKSKEYIKLCSSEMDGSFEKKFEYFWGRQYTCSFDEYIEMVKTKGVEGKFEIIIKKQGFQEYRVQYDLQNTKYRNGKEIKIELENICLNNETV